MIASLWLTTAFARRDRAHGGGVVRRRPTVLRTLAVIFVVAALPMVAAISAPAEYQVKAVFLFNFSQFVEWPAEAFATAEAPFVIGVIGQDPFGGHLEAAVQGETVLGHPLVVKRYGKVADLQPCHILFISTAEPAQLDDVLGSLDGQAILTVSDMTEAAERGAIIQFTSEQNRLRLRINVAAAKAAGLTISSKLLRPAEIVTQRG